MWKAALAGALALVAAGVMPVSAQEHLANPAMNDAKSAAVEARIAGVKASLRLRADQERYWPRIASAIRAYANRPRPNGDSSEGALKRAATKALYAQRIASAAAPLMKVLDSEQRQVAVGLIQALGFGHLAAR
jgi:hypothetical protein